MAIVNIQPGTIEKSVVYALMRSECAEEVDVCPARHNDVA